MDDRRDELIRFRDALDNATDAIGMSTPEGRHYYQNRAFTELFGDIGEDPRVSLYRDNALAQKVFDAIMAGGSWSGEVEMFDSTGGVRNVLLRAYAGKDQGGRVTALVGIHTDITELKLVSHAAAEGMERLRAVSDNLPEGLVYQIDSGLDGRDRRFTYISAKVMELHGCTAAEALADPARVYSQVSPQDRAALEELESRAFQSMQAFSAEVRVILPSGKTAWRQFSSAPRRLPNGHVVWDGVEIDVTHRKRDEEVRRRVSSLESLGTVAGGLAHDFNNLLMGVFGNIELAREAMPDGHPAVESLHAAYGALDRARQLTTRLLTFAKGGNPVLESLDLRQQIRDTVSFHLAGSSVAARFDVPDDLWAVTADKTQIVEVIANLTVNAREAMPRGGTLFVRAGNVQGARCADSTDHKGDAVELVFRDEGVGIPESQLDNIFTPYFTTKEAGSGLGLAIVHGVVRRHKGHVSVESQVGVGTTFTVCLPADGEARPAAGDLSPVPDGSSHPCPVRILVMDDQEVIRTMAALMLERLGYSVDTAAHGQEAIEMYERARNEGQGFDLTIVDLTVPAGLGGQETVLELLRRDPRARVIVSSGYSSDPIMAQFAAHGFVGCLPKPYSLKELNQVVSRVLRQ
jgi:PAS domain S-box-containing protein